MSFKRPLQDSCVGGCLFHTQIISALSVRAYYFFFSFVKLRSVDDDPFPFSPTVKKEYFRLHCQERRSLKNEFVLDYRGAISTLLSYRYTLLCRPTCNGKTMLLSTIEDYFNVARGHSCVGESDFAVSRDGDDPLRHPYRASFHVIKIHVVYDYQPSQEKRNPYSDALNFSLHSLVKSGRTPSASDIELHPTCGFTSLKIFAKAIKDSVTPRLMILIDDYDNFINYRMASRSDYNSHVLSSTSPLRALLEVLQSLETVGLPQYHTIMTGITPLPINDLGEAAKHVQNLSAHPSLSGALGLDEVAVVRAMVEIGQSRKEAHQIVLNAMRSAFGTSQFCPDRGSSRVFNTLEALRFLSRYASPDEHLTAIISLCPNSSRRFHFSFRLMLFFLSLLINFFSGKNQMITRRVKILTFVHQFSFCL